MPVEIFSREEFESALPVHKESGAKLWQSNGLINGEFTYHVLPFPTLPYGIEVRSSVKANGYSADCGEDSIRAWIVNNDGKAFGSKISRYTTRVPGWQDRMANNLRALAKMIRKITPCECCGNDRPTFKVKKEGDNKGRLFSRCINESCKKPEFTWIDP